MVIIYHFVVKCEFQNASPQVLSPVIKWKKDEHLGELPDNHRPINFGANTFVNVFETSLYRS